jgi:spore germination protein KC
VKRAVITVFIVLSVVSAMNRGSSFPSMTEITLAEPVFVIGIDLCRGDDSSSESPVKVSIIYEKIESGDEGGDSPGKKYTDSAVGSSPAAALETLKKRFPREMAISTADYFLIGEAAAEAGLAQYIDFLAKNNTLRLNASVFIVQGSAQEAAEVLVETRTLDILRNYGEYSGINSVSSKLKFYELLRELAGTETTAAFAVPALVIKQHEEEKIVVPSGYAIVRDDVLKGFLDADTARGYNILRNKSVFSVVELPGIETAVRLENAKSRISFNWDGDDLTEIVVNADIFTSVIGGDSESLSEKEQNRVIFGELQRVVSASKKYNCDFLGFGETLRMRHPLRWERIKDNWHEIYDGTPVIISVNSNIRGL